MRHILTATTDKQTAMRTSTRSRSVSRTAAHYPVSSTNPAISATTVSTVVHDIHARYEGRPLRDYVPLFVERNAKSELDRLGATAG